MSFTCQVKPVVRALIAAEAEVRGLSQGKLIDDLVLASCRSPQAIAVIQEFAKREPLNIVLAEELAQKPKSKSKANNKTKPKA